MTDPSFQYCIDTSSLVHAYQRSYPPDVIPALWENKLDELIDSGKLISPYDVYDELQKKHDELFAWAKQREKLFVEIDQFEDELAEIMKEYPRLVDTRKGKSGADPMVVALAVSKNPQLTVITEEGFGNETSPRIPYVCSMYNLRCINVLQLLRDQAWQF